MPVAEGALHPLIAVWDAKAADARASGDGNVNEVREAYLMGKADAYEEAADALEALTGRPRR